MMNLVSLVLEILFKTMVPSVCLRWLFYLCGQIQHNRKTLSTWGWHCHLGSRYYCSLTKDYIVNKWGIIIYIVPLRYECIIIQYFFRQIYKTICSSLWIPILKENLFISVHMCLQALLEVLFTQLLCPFPFWKFCYKSKLLVSAKCLSNLVFALEHWPRKLKAKPGFHYNFGPFLMGLVKFQLAVQEVVWSFL